MKIIDEIGFESWKDGKKEKIIFAFVTAPFPF